MGFDENRFASDIDNEFKCSICLAIIECPVMILKCEHIFCKECIKQCIVGQKMCPIDRKPVKFSELCQPNRTFRNMYSKLEIKCQYEPNGCQTITTIEALAAHQDSCQFNPKNKRLCDKQCGAFISGDQLKSHNCVRYLKAIIAAKDQELEKLKTLKVEQNSISYDSNSVHRARQLGTYTKFKPILGTDTEVVDGFAKSVFARHQSISSMNQYKDKSYEELRLEDYLISHINKEIFNRLTSI